MFENQTYDAIMGRMLGADILKGVDRRQGSIIFDALAPAGAEMAELYLADDAVLDEFFIQTASRGYLTLHGEGYNCTPLPATAAVVVGEFSPADIDVSGREFSAGKVNYRVTEFVSSDDGAARYRLTCTTSGEAGNVSDERLIPVEEIEGLKSARIVGIDVTGGDDEDTEVYRERLTRVIKNPPFGGNVADYQQKILAMNGVGMVRVSPATDERKEKRGGHVLIEVLDNDYKPISGAEAEKITAELTGGGENGMGYGLAPIGHKVHVMAPETRTVSINARVTLAAEPSGEASAQEAARLALAEYFNEIRDEWQANIAKDDIKISVIRLIAALSEVYDIETVGEMTVTIDGSATSVFSGERLVQSLSIGSWALPILGEVKLS